MKNLLLTMAALLVALSAAAQTGTNSGDSQVFGKPRTGRNDQVITSPDINAAITGTMGSTTGQPPDVANATSAIAGTSSAASLSTAEVSTRETMERQRLLALIGKTQPTATPEIPSPPFIATSTGGQPLNGRIEAETSRLAGLQQGPSTDSGPEWANAQPKQQTNQQPSPPTQKKKP